MRRMIFALCALVALASTTACGSSSSDPGGGSGGDFVALLQGTWKSPCSQWTSGTATYSEQSVVVFSGQNISSTLYDYSNGTCSGTGTVFDSSTGSFTVVGTVTANLGSTSVTAYQVNGTNSGTPGQTFYDLAYVNTSVTPNRLYAGDTSGVNDGSTAAKRPTTLDSTSYMLKQ